MNSLGLPGLRKGRSQGESGCQGKKCLFFPPLFSKYLWQICECRACEGERDGSLSSIPWTRGKQKDGYFNVRGTTDTDSHAETPPQRQLPCFHHHAGDDVFSHSESWPYYRQKVLGQPPPSSELFARAWALVHLRMPRAWPPRGRGLGRAGDTCFPICVELSPDLKACEGTTPWCPWSFCPRHLACGGRLISSGCYYSRCCYYYHYTTERGSEWCVFSCHRR